MDTPSDPSLKKYRVAHMDGVSPTPCPCGLARRAFCDEPEGIASLHLVDIKEDSRVHYHKKLTEIYYILEGEGHAELDGEKVPLRPGSSVLIKAGCRHRAVGKLKLLNVVVPSFDAEDEWFD